MLKKLLREVFKGSRRSTESEAVSIGFDTAPWLARHKDVALDDTAQRSALFEALSTHLQHLSSTGATAPSVDLLAGWRLLGDWHLQHAEYDAAETAYRRALRCNPIDASTQEGMGLTLLYRNRLDEAWLHFEVAHRSAPMNSEVLNHWGLVALELGNLNVAADLFQKALDRKPRNPHAWQNLALVRLRAGDVAGAIERFDRALSIDPSRGLVHSNLALALMQADRLNDAVIAARRATELKGKSARVWVVLGDILIALGDLASAGSALTKALALDPVNAGAHLGLAKLNMSSRRFTEARKAFEVVLGYDPEHAEARAGLGQLELQLGQWTPGWDNYESRRRIESSPVRKFPFQEWDGIAVPGRVLLVHAEQGMGDIVMFASCLPDLQAQCPNVIAEVPLRLERLFRRSFPWVDVIGHDVAESGVSWLEGHSEVDCQVAIGSLPKIFRRAARDFPKHQGFLHADVDQVNEWREKLGSDDRPIIGISWRGGLAMTAKYQRSLSLATMVSSLKSTGARLVNLQYGDVADEITETNQLFQTDIDPGLAGYVDIDELASITAACDCVITVCSTMAHLAGALGRPGLVLVPTAANWRYGTDGSEMPWYPSLKLVRQTADGDWSEVLGYAAAWIRNLSKQAVPPQIEGTK